MDDLELRGTDPADAIDEVNEAVNETVNEVTVAAPVVDAIPAETSEPVKPVAEETYMRASATGRQHTPTAEDIKAYRVGSQLPGREVSTKYNQPRPARDADYRSPNVRTGMAIASLVLGFISFTLFWVPYFGFVTPILALLFGGIGLAQSTSQPDSFGGKGMAITGIVLGLVALGLAFLSLSMLGCVVSFFRTWFQF